MTRDIICVACPMGCGLRVELNGAGEIAGVSGHTCKRGEAYAQAEITNPTRMFHSTLRVEGGATPLVSVKSAAPVPKPRLMDCAKATRGIKIKAPVAIGDVLLPNVCGTGIDLVATGRVSAA
jgi:CxxC motif-containing protein